MANGTKVPLKVIRVKRTVCPLAEGCFRIPLTNQGGMLMQTVTYNDLFGLMLVVVGIISLAIQLIALPQKKK